MKVTLTPLAFLVCLAVTLTSFVWGQSGANKTRLLHTLPDLSTKEGRQLAHAQWVQRQKITAIMCNNAWLHGSWTANDEPYTALRDQIDRASNTTSPEALVARYAPAAKARPNDPLAQFAWGYAVYKANTSSKAPLANAETTRFAAELAIDRAPFPNTYNAARLHLLLILEGPGGYANYYLIGTAHRLLQKKPGDFPVKIGLIGFLSNSPDVSSQKQGYALIQQIIKQSPEEPLGYDLLGGWHFAQYLMYNKLDDYQSAKDNYEKALTMYPTASARRADLSYLIDFLTTRYHKLNGGQT